MNIHPQEPELSELYQIRSDLHEDIVQNKTKEKSRQMHALNVQIKRHEIIKFSNL